MSTPLGVGVQPSRRSEPRRVEGPEESLAGAHERRVNEQAVLVDQLMPDEVLEEHAAAEHGDRAG
jgi:hypothetical protein